MERTSGGSDVIDVKQAEEALRRERDLASAVLDTAGAVVVVLDRQGRIVRFNRACEKITGYSATEVLGRVWEFLVPSEELPGVREAWETLKTGNFPNAHESHWLAKDGSRRLIAWSNTALANGAGEVHHIIGTGIDITERKQAEEALHRSESSLAAAQSIAHIGSWEWDTVRNTAHWSPETFRIFGLVSGTLGEHRQSFLDMIHPEDRAGVDQALRDAVNGTKEYDLEYRIVHPDQAEKTIHALAQVIRTEDGRPILMRGTVHDITERKKAEEALRASEEKYRRLFDDAVLGVFQTTPTGKIITVNPAYARMFGYSSPDELMAAVSDVACLYADPSHRPSIVRTIEEAHQPVCVENLYKRKDGSAFVGNLHAWTVCDGKGELIFEGFVEDITERRRAEASLKESEERYHSVFQSSLDGIMLIRVDGTILAANKAVCETLRMTEEEVLRAGRTGVAVDDERLRAAVTERAKTGKWQGELTARRSDGSTFPVEISTNVFAGADGKQMIAAVVRDITERKEAEEKLRTSRVQLAEAADLARIAYWEYDETTGQFVFNDGFYELYGTTAEQEGGYRMPREEYLRRFVHPDDLEALSRQIDENMARPHSGVFTQYEHRGVCRDGEEIRILTRNRVVTDPERRALKVVGVNQDITARKGMEEALRESKARLDLALQSASMGVWHWDLAQDRRYFDDQACYLLGIEPAAFTGTGDEFFRVVHPDDREMLRAALAGTIEQDLSYEPQYRAVWPDGSVHHIAARGKLVRNEASDRPERINGIIWDVTERVNAEQALRQSEERFATVFRSSPIGISLARLSDGQYLDVNDAFLRFFGYEREEVIGRDPFSLGIWVHVEDRTGMVDILREQGRVPGFETVFRMKTGEIRNALVVTELVDVAQERYLLGLTLDITERKQAEEALIQSEKKYRSIFDNAIEGIFQTTPDGRYLTVNPALARMYGYTSPEEMMGAVTDLQEQQYVIPEDRVRLKALYEQQGFVKRFEAQVYTKSGDKVWISMNAYAVADRAGNTLYYEGTAENITERKRLEDQLRQAQKMEAIGTLAGGVAHDFNNILTVIMGLGNLIQMSIDKGDTLRPYIDQIVASSERAADLTQSLLAFSRRQRITPEAHTVNGVVTSTAKLLKRLLPEDIELKCDLTDKKTLTMLDLTQIGQVIMNLAINARDAMPHGGSLIIRTERSKLDENFKKIHGFGRPGNYVKLSVSDTGIGMDESTMKRIFEPFFTTKEVGKGTGLGLASAYGIVKQHDGYITVSSALSMGTTFDIYLPLIDTPHPRRVSAVPETKGGAETILIVEDDRDVRSTLTRILEKQGYITIEAMDGDDALRLYEEHRTEVDLIILDVVMPGRNGKEVLDEITRINPSVKAVFVSGYTGDIVIDKGVENDSVDFLQKPLSVPKLLSKVREVLDR